MALMRTSLEVVSTPTEAPPEDADEIFIRLCLYEPGVETDDDPAVAFTMPVSALLRMLYGIAADVREIVHNDVSDWPLAFGNFNPN